MHQIKTWFTTDSLVVLTENNNRRNATSTHSWPGKNSYLRVQGKRDNVIEQIHTNLDECGDHNSNMVPIIVPCHLTVGQMTIS